MEKSSDILLTGILIMLGLNTLVLSIILAFIVEEINKKKK